MYYVFLIACCCSWLDLGAQHSRFELSLIAGINFSELEGEGVTDYYGLNTGLMSTSRLSEKWQLAIEGLFSQNGEYLLPEFYPRVDYGRIRLNYLEIPIHLDRLIRSNSSKSYRDISIQWGAAYVRLLNYFGETKEGKDISDEIIWDRREGWVIQSGLTYYPRKSVGVQMRTAWPWTAGLSWTISLRVLYTILQKQ